MTTTTKPAGSVSSVQDCNTLEEYVAAYGTLLGKQAAEDLVPLHMPATDAVCDFSPLLRQPFTAQAHVATAGVRALQRQKTLNIVAECGTGKTLLSLATSHTHAGGKPYRGIVFCPPHLVGKWQREIEETIPDAIVHQLRSYRDLTHLRRWDKPTGNEWFVVSGNTAKMESEWKAAYCTRKTLKGIPHCSNCGNPVLKEDAKTKRTVPVPPTQLRKKRTWCDECGGALWTHTHKLDRWPVAKIANKKLKGMFNYVIFDEVHQCKGDDTAIGRAMGALAAASKKIITATGTIIGGYANHLRSILFRVAPESLVADGLRWEDAMKFDELYGRIETTITEKSGGGSGADNRSSSGSQSKTVRRNVRPGIMPSIMKHLIGTTVFLSLDEVSDNLPTLEEQVIAVPMDAKQAKAYKFVEEKLAAAIKQMIAKGDRRLLGKMLNTLLGYPDHPHGYGEIGYYEKDPDGANQAFVKVCDVPDLNREKVRPKEQALLDLVAKEKAVGRQVWVFSTMTTKRDVTARLEKLLAAAGHTVKVLRSSQVETRKREDWLEKHGPECDVVISHPKLVETGLDLFSKKGAFNFVTLAFYNTGYSTFVLRQASRRSWRIGQTLPCKVVYFYYADTMQARAINLMGKKLVASQAVEGKFSSEGLAAMAGDEGSMEMALAKSLVEKLDDLDAVRSWERITQATQGNAAVVAAAAAASVAARTSARNRELRAFVRMVVHQPSMFDLVDAVEAVDVPAGDEPPPAGSESKPRGSVRRPHSPTRPHSRKAVSK